MLYSHSHNLNTWLQAVDALMHVLWVMPVWLVAEMYHSVVLNYTWVNKVFRVSLFFCSLMLSSRCPCYLLFLIITSFSSMSAAYSPSLSSYLDLWKSSACIGYTSLKKNFIFCLCSWTCYALWVVRATAVELCFHFFSAFYKLYFKVFW